MQVSHEMLNESKSVRNSALAKKSATDSYKALCKAKALVMALWKGVAPSTGVAPSVSTDQGKTTNPIAISHITLNIFFTTLVPTYISGEYLYSINILLGCKRDRSSLPSPYLRHLH